MAPSSQELEPPQNPGRFKLLANDAVKSYIGRHEPEILTHLELVVNTVSMEEAVQQPQKAEA